VNDENKPLALGRVRLIGAPEGPKTNLTSSDGMVEFNLPPGVNRESLKCDISFPGYENQLVSVGMKDELILIKLVARHMKLKVAVVDQRTGRPVSNAQVEILAHSTKLSDAAGKCDFDNSMSEQESMRPALDRPGNQPQALWRLYDRS
jgi:hypothetical protein